MCRNRSPIADYVYFLANGGVSGGRHPAELRASRTPRSGSSSMATPDGPFKFHYPSRTPLAADLGLRSEGMISRHRTIGASAASARLGSATASFCVWSSNSFRCCAGRALITRSDPFYRQLFAVDHCGFGLVRRLCAGFAGLLTLNRYGSEQALGLLVALSLVRELGPVVTALLFAGRAGTSLTAEIGLMKAGEQLTGMEMMAVDPLKVRGRAALLGGHCRHADSGGHFQRGRYFRRLCGRRAVDRRRFGRVLVADAGRRRCLERCGQRRGQEHGVRLRCDVHRAVPGL